MRFLIYGFGLTFLIALVSFVPASAQDDIPTLVLQDAQGSVGDNIVMDLVLASAPEGLQQYSFSITVANTAVASISLDGNGIAQIQGVELSGQLFQVSASASNSASFRALDLNDDIRSGDTDLVLAQITFVANGIGVTEVQLGVDAFVDDRGVKLDPQIQFGTISVQAGNGSQPPPNNEQTPPVVEVMTPRAIPGGVGEPQDLDGDGLYEDVNGDGVFNNNDVSLLLSSLGNAQVQEDRDFFDFNQDGVLDNQDVNVLLDRVVPPSTPETPTTPEAPRAEAVLQLTSTRANVAETASVDLVLADAPEGLERYEVTVSIAPAGVARILGVEGVGIPSDFLQLVSVSDTQIRFRVADLSDLVRPGSLNLVLARLRLQGLGAGTVSLNLSVELFTNESSEFMPASVRHGTAEFFVGPSAVEPGLNAPNDLDGDGLFEDVNGDGVFNNDDAVLFAFQLENPIVLANIEFFDFNGDGQITFADATALSRLALPGS